VTDVEIGMAANAMEYRRYWQTPLVGDPVPDPEAL